MFKITEFVPASLIWPNAKDFIDKGRRQGLVRGYNIEVVRNSTKETFWMSCEYISVEPEVEFNDDFHNYYYKEYGLTPTGRISFRGYGIKRWNQEIGEYIEHTEVD